MTNATSCERNPSRDLIRIEVALTAAPTNTHLLVDDALLPPLDFQDTLRPEIARGHEHAYSRTLSVPQINLQRAQSSSDLW